MKRGPIYTAGEREVTLHGLDRLTELQRLRISCMPAPSPGFASDALWRIVVPTTLMRLRWDPATAYPLLLAAPALMLGGRANAVSRNVLRHNVWYVNMQCIAAGSCSFWICRRRLASSAPTLGCRPASAASSR